MLWFIAFALAALALSSESEEVPSSPATECPMVRITPEVLQARKAYLGMWIADWKDAANASAIAGVTELAAAIFPDCKWGADDDRAIIGIDGRSTTWQQIRTAIAGKTVGEVAANGSEIFASIWGTPPMDAALPPQVDPATTLAVGFLGPAILAPPAPPIVEPPVLMPLEGAGAPVQQSVQAQVVCDRVRQDGDAKVCLRAAPGGGWSWTWTRGTVELTGTAKDSTDALVAAYLAARTQPVAWVIEAPLERFGVRLTQTGSLELVDAIAWGQAMYQRLLAQWTRGNRDPATLLLSAVQAAYPAVNWFRVSPPPGPPQGASMAVERIGAAVHTPNVPDIVDRVARAIVGAQFEPFDHVWRGKRIRLRQTTIDVPGAPGGLGSSQLVFQYKINDGSWVGAYATADEASNAAHGVTPPPIGGIANPPPGPVQGA